MRTAIPKQSYRERCGQHEQPWQRRAWLHVENVKGSDCRIEIADSAHREAAGGLEALDGGERGGSEIAVNGYGCALAVQQRLQRRDAGACTTLIDCN